MRLPTKPKKKIVTKEKQSKQKRKEKKTIEKGLYKNYKDKRMFDGPPQLLKMNKLRYGIIDGAKLNSVELPDGEIKLDKSWVGLMLLMLDTLFQKVGKSGYKETLTVNKITSQKFNVEPVYGKYEFNGDIYDAYNIFETGYYLELVEDSDVIYRALVGLCRALEIDYEDIRFNIEQKEEDLGITYVDDPEIKVLQTKRNNYVSINKMNIRHFRDYKLEEVLFTEKGESYKITDTNVLLVLFIKWAVNEYDYADILHLPRTDKIGVSLINESDTDIKIGNIYLYYRGGIEDINKFIRQSCKHLGIKDNEIVVKYEK